MSQAHMAKQDKAGAIKDLEKAIELDPGNVQAKAQLDTLKQ
jgi:Tfp pilus assembly protein PilF